MTATDQLRRLLDERGIEYEPIDSVHSPNRRTLWGEAERSKGVFGMCFKYETIEFKKGMRLTISDCSPAQAVEATLGRGTCHDMYTDDDEWFACSECNTELRVHEPFGVIGSIRFCPNCGARVVDA